MNSTKYSSMLGKSVKESTNIDIRTTNTENNDLTLPNVFNSQIQQVLLPEIASDEKMTPATFFGSMNPFKTV